MSHNEQKDSQPPRAVSNKHFGTGYEIALGLIVGFFVVYRVEDLISELFNSRITVPFNFYAEQAPQVDLGETSVSLIGITNFSTSTTTLAAGTIGFLVAAKILFVLTVVACAIAFIPTVRDIGRGTPFTQRATTSLKVLSWSFLSGFFLYVAATTFGSNMAASDLRLSHEIGSSVSTSYFGPFLIIALSIELLRRCFKSGQKAQEELEGLV